MFEVDARGGGQQSTFQVKMHPPKNLIVINDNLPSYFQEVLLHSTEDCLWPLRIVVF